MKYLDKSRHGVLEMLKRWLPWLHLVHQVLLWKPELLCLLAEHVRDAMSDLLEWKQINSRPEPLGIEIPGLISASSRPVRHRVVPSSMTLWLTHI